MAYHFQNDVYYHYYNTGLAVVQLGLQFSSHPSHITVNQKRLIACLTGGEVEHWPPSEIDEELLLEHVMDGIEEANLILPGCAQ